MSDQKNWLKRLKDESWEAELLVSVASIFAIFKAFPALHWLVDYFIDHLQPSQYFYGYMICFMGYLAFGILGSFFVIHFGLRAYWIGLVGLNSVFPDYSMEDSAFSKIYTQKMTEKLPKLPKTIDVLDEVCSVIFSVAFTLLCIYLYFGLLCSLILLLFNLLKSYISPNLLALPLYAFGLFFIILMVFSLMANLKKNKENEKMQLWYFRLSLLTNKIMYGPLYKYFLQTTLIFGSNFKKKKALVRTMTFMIIFGLILGVFQIFQSNVLYLLRANDVFDQSRFYPEFYAENNEEAAFLLNPEIQGDVLHVEPLELFVPLFNFETSILKNSCRELQQDFDLGNSKDRKKRWKANLSCYSKTIQVFVNQENIPIEFLKTNHGNTGQFGLTGKISPEVFNTGMNELKITKTVENQKTKNWFIPFYYNGK